MKKICLNIKIHIPVILRNYRFLEIDHNPNYYNDQNIDNHVNRIYKDNLFPFFESIKQLSAESGGKFKVGISISGITLKLLEKIVPRAIGILSDLEQNGNIEFLSEPFSQSIIPFLDKRALALQTLLHDKMIRSKFGQTPDVFIVHSPISKKEIWRAILEHEKKVVFISSDTINRKTNQIDSEDILSLLNNGVYLINHSLSQLLQNMDFHPNRQVMTDFASRILKRVKTSLPQEHPIVLIYNPGAITKPFNQNRALAWKTIFNQLLTDADVHFAFPSEILKTSGHFFTENDLSAKVIRQFKIPADLWTQNDLQKNALQEQLAIHELMEDYNCTALIEDWNNIQDMDNLYYMNDHFFSKEYCENNFSPYSSPYLAFINYMNILEDLSGRLRKEKETFSGINRIAPVIKPLVSKNIILEMEHADSFTEKLATRK